MDYEKIIGVYPDFPKEGIAFKDITPLVANGEAFHSVIDDLAKLAEKYQPDLILGAESRGFIFGSALAYKMGLGFLMGRKAEIAGRNHPSELCPRVWDGHLGNPRAPLQGRHARALDRRPHGNRRHLRRPQGTRRAGGRHPRRRLDPHQP